MYDSCECIFSWEAERHIGLGRLGSRVDGMSGISTIIIFAIMFMVMLMRTTVNEWGEVKKVLHLYHWLQHL